MLCTPDGPRQVVNAVIALVILVTPALLSSQALAGHGDNDTSLSDRSGNVQEVEWVGLTNAGVVACEWGAARLEETEISLISGYDEITCADSDYNASWFALTSCQSVQNGRCLYYLIRFDLDYGQIDNNTERDYYRSAGCQEFGHTSSIGHRASDTGNPSCMLEPSTNLYFDSHDVAEIDADYP